MRCISAVLHRDVVGASGERRGREAGLTVTIQRHRAEQISAVKEVDGARGCAGAAGDHRGKRDRLAAVAGILVAARRNGGRRTRGGSEVEIAAVNCAAGAVVGGDMEVIELEAIESGDRSRHGCTAGASGERALRGGHAGAIGRGQAVTEEHRRSGAIGGGGAIERGAGLRDRRGGGRSR